MTISLAITGAFFAHFYMSRHRNSVSRNDFSVHGPNNVIALYHKHITPFKQAFAENLMIVIMSI